MTLSIGDGANDVAMIQEANIGCGLLGHEGSQAAMSADYAFGQFRFLTKLLLVHGRWSYQRVADMHANFFYKVGLFEEYSLDILLMIVQNVIWTFAMFWFMIFNSFDATYLYQYTFILLYNLVFTSLPVIALGGKELTNLYKLAADNWSQHLTRISTPRLHWRSLSYTSGVSGVSSTLDSNSGCTCWTVSTSRLSYSSSRTSPGRSASPFRGMGRQSSPWPTSVLRCPWPLLFARIPTSA